MSSHSQSSILIDPSGIVPNRRRDVGGVHRLGSLPLAIGALALVVASGCGPGGGSEGGRCDEVLPGDLVISEFMHNVPSDRRESGQWFEIYNPTKEDIELSGLTIYRSQHSGSARRTERLTSGVVPAGGYYVFGNASEDDMPEWMDHSYGDRLGNLNLERGRIGILCGTKVLDEVVYEGRGSVDKSRGFDGNATPDASANDDMARWCDATTEYAPGLFGTPGAPNDDCEPVIEDPNVCLDAETGEPRDIVRPEPGDLRITEILTSAGAVSDNVGEWVELYASKDVDLNGLELRNEGTGKTAFTTATCLRIPADSYAVLARSDDPEENGGIENVLATFTFNLANTGERTVELWNDDTLIDRVEYTSSTKGASRQFAPETEESEDFVWCVTPEGFTYGDGDRGTPGEANPPCDAEAPVDPVDPDPVTCVDPVSGEERESVPPAAGELRITEFLSSVGAVSDNVGEWVELYASKDVDLNGLELRNEGSGRTAFTSDTCLRIPADSYVVLARSDDPGVNGGIENVLATFTFNLANTGERAVELWNDDTLIDRVEYTSSTKGASRQFAPETEDSEEYVWCLTPEGFTYGGGDRGTPGEPNVSCDAKGPTDPVDPVDPDPVTCVDPVSGEERERVSPTLGDLRITEVMANVGAVTDAVGEWVEVEVLADVDLNDVTLRNEGTGSTVLTSETCIAVAAGSLLVFARSANPEDNGGIEGVFKTFSFNLANSNDRAVRLTLGEVELDRMEYSSTTRGVSLQLAARTNVDPELIWCPTPAGYTYGLGDRGTPGEANPPCEIVDVDPPEAMCFDSDLGEERLVRFATPGDLIITELHADPRAVTNSVGEWLEITVREDVDLNELTVRNEGAGSTTLKSEACLSVTAGSRIVLARSADPAVNGGIEDVFATFSFSFANTGDRGASLMVGDVEIDSMRYSSTTSGVSWQLAERSNVDPELIWCLTPVDAVYGDGDRGTPGAENPPCEVVPVDPPETTCFDDELDKDRPVVLAGPDDISISEIHVNPAAVSSDAGQWVEIVVNAAVDLNGLALGDGGNEEVLFDSASCLSAAPGTRLVLARSADSTANGGVDVVDIVFNASLPLSFGTVRLSVDEVTIDSVSYGEVEAGVSLQFAEATDEDPTLTWCPTPEGAVFGDGDRGTPGAENPPCEVLDVDPPEPTCFDSDLDDERPVVLAGPGDVSISEIHVNPAAVSSDVGQWVEIVVNAAVDLNGLALGDGGDGETVFSFWGSCLRVEPGTHLVLGRSADSSVNGGVEGVYGTFNTNLPLSHGTVRLSVDEVTIDSVSYDEVEAGVSLQYAAATDEDPSLTWCPTPEDVLFGDGDRGSPGMENLPCEVVEVVPPGPVCFDVALNAQRLVEFPSPGDLLITELLINSTVRDQDGEYIEIYATTDVDLNGVLVGYDDQTRKIVTTPDCVRLAQGEFGLIVRKSDPGVNGGLPSAPIVGEYTFQLANSNDRSVRLHLDDDDETLLTEVTYTGANVSKGISFQLDPTYFGLAASEDPANWCLTPEGNEYQGFNEGDDGPEEVWTRGTPGEENVACPVVIPEGSCLDTETNSVRPILVPEVGDIIITEFLASTQSGVTDTNGEWIELWASKGVDLNGLSVRTAETGGSGSVLNSDEQHCLHVPANTHALIARNSDPEVNGGLPPVIATFGINLASPNASIPERYVVLRYGNETLDIVAYDVARSGISFQLDIDSYDHLLDDEIEAVWCETPDTVNPRRTPRELNVSCSD